MNKEARKVLKDATSRLLLDHRALGATVMNLSLVEDENIPTACTDGTHMWYNPDFVLGLSFGQVMFLLAHEDYHCLYNHHTRLGQRDPTLWNVAGDYRINFDLLELIKAGGTIMELIPDILLSDQWPKESTEEIYAVLEDQKNNQQNQPQNQQGQGQGQGSPGDGGQGGQSSPKNGQNKPPSSPADSGNGKGARSGTSQGKQAPSSAPQGAVDPGNCGGVVQAAPASNPGALQAEERKWEQIARRAIFTSTKEAGTLPGYMKRIAEDIERPRIDYKARLLELIDSSMARQETWSRPNKRYLGEGLYLPSFDPSALDHLLIMPDFSGSIRDKLLNDYQGVVQDVLDSGIADKVTVAYWDTDIKATKEYYPGDRVKLESNGGGGTSLEKPMEWVRKNHDDATAILILTDLHVWNFGKAPSPTVIFAAYLPYDQFKQKKVPYGETMRFGE